MGVARYDPDRRGYRIFVGNLSGVTTHDDLANLFSAFGPIVDVWLASNPPGFGFVVFKNAADAEKAVTEKNSSVYLSRVIKVQHARMFRDRPTRSTATGSQGYTDSDSSRSSRSRSSRSRSGPRSRSRSRSRSSRRWSRSSSRLSYFSRLYGTARKRSRSSSRSRSRARSNASMRTLSAAESDQRSKSRCRSEKSRSRSGTKSRSSRRPHHGRRSSHHGQRHSRRSRRRRKRRRRHRRNSHSSSRSDASSITSHHSRPSRSPSSSSRPPKRSSCRPQSSPSRRARQRDAGCRHCRHCKDRTSSVTSNGSTRRVSSSSASDRGTSPRKTKRHRRSWRRSKRTRRRSSSSSSSSLSSSSSTSSLPPDQRQVTRTALDCSSASDNRGNCSDAASESAKMMSRTTCPSPRAVQGSNTHPLSPSDTLAQEPESSAIVSVPVPSASSPYFASGSAPGGNLASACDTAVSSFTPGDAVTGTHMETSAVSVDSASECVANASSPSTGEGMLRTSAGSPKTCGVGDFASVASDGAASSHQTLTQKRPSSSSIDRTQIRFSLTRKVPSFSLEVSQKEKSREKKEANIRNSDWSNSSAQEKSGESVKDPEIFRQPSSSTAENDPMDTSDACADVRMSQDLDDMEITNEETQSETFKEKKIKVQDQEDVSLKNITHSANAALQTPVTDSISRHDEQSDHKRHTKKAKLHRENTDMPKATMKVAKENPAKSLNEETLGVSPDDHQDHNNHQKSSDFLSKEHKVDDTPSLGPQQSEVQPNGRSDPEDHRNIADRKSLHTARQSVRSWNHARSELSTQSGISSENSGSKQRSSLHDLPDSVCSKGPLKQKNSTRNASRRSSVSPPAYQSRSSFSSRQLASRARFDRYPGFPKRRYEVDNNGCRRDIFCRDDRERSELGYMPSSECSKRWRLIKRRGWNENEQMKPRSPESSWHFHSAERKTDRVGPTVKMRKVSSEIFPRSSCSDRKEEDGSRSSDKERANNRSMSRDRRKEDRGLGSDFLSSVDNEHVQFHHEDKCRAIRQESPSVNGNKRRSSCSKSSSFGEKMKARYRLGDRKSVDRILSPDGDRTRSEIRHSSKSKTLLSSQNTSVHCKHSELEASDRNDGRKLKLDREVKTSGTHLNTENIELRSSGQEKISKTYRKREHQENRDITVSKSLAARTCQPKSSSEAADGNKGRRVLLPTPKPGLLPIPSSPLLEPAAELTVAPRNRPTSSFSHSLGKCGQSVNKETPDCSNGSLRYTLSKPSPNSLKDKRKGTNVEVKNMSVNSLKAKSRDTNVEAKNMSVSKPQGHTRQSKYKTLPDTASKKQESENSAQKNQQKVLTDDRNPRTGDTYQVTENSHKIGPVRSKVETVERTSDDHRSSDGDAEHTPKLQLKSKILLVRKSWESSNLPEDK